MVSECDQRVHARGHCKAHYLRLIRRGTTDLAQSVPLVERFWSKVNRSDSCWTWTGAVNEHGYGLINVNHRSTLAHRVAWELTNGEITAGASVCHVCDNPPCVRPDHLWLGDPLSNARDMTRKGRAATAERHFSRTQPERIARGERITSHVLTEADVLAIRAAYTGKRGEPADMARAYGVSPGTVMHVLRRTTWSHL